MASSSKGKGKQVEEEKVDSIRFRAEDSIRFLTADF
jgi:hypothetical protein